MASSSWTATLTVAQTKDITSPKYSPFSHVPGEIVVVIAEFLEPPDLNALIQTSRPFADLLDSTLYDRALTFERNDPTWATIRVLEWASLYGRLTVAEKLLKRNADISIKDPGGWNLLHNAIEYGQGTTAQLFLDAGVDPAARVSDGSTALHLATARGYVEIVRSILARGFDLSIKGTTGRTVLHVAAWGGYAELARMFLDAGADVLAMDYQGLTPLHLAFACGFKDVGDILLDAGADLAAKSRRRNSVLSLACDKGHKPEVQRLLELHRMKGISIEERDEMGWAPLHIAVNHGYDSITRILLEYGADPMHDLDGNKPLHLATKKGYESIARLLLEKGADVEASGPDGVTALHLAASHGFTPMIDLLLAHHADIAATSDTGSQPLHYAAFNGQEDALEALIRNGANINATDDYSDRTPLHWAAEAGKETTVDLLINAGADIITDHDGRSPLEIAAAKKHWSTVEYFTQLNVNLVTPFALRSAVLGQQEALIKLFMSLGVDPLRLDDFGRNAMDWASLHPPTLDMMKLSWNLEYEPTEKTITTKILRETIVHAIVAIKARKGGPGDQLLQLYELGRYLLFIEDLDEATTAYQLWISPSIDNTIICDLCGNAFQEDHYACRECPDIDLCSNCMDAYCRDNLQICLCQGHPFLHVPPHTADTIPEGKVNSQGESRDEWLSRLAKTYSLPQQSV